MERKLIGSAGMPCTRDQYENDLKDHLKEIGVECLYGEYYSFWYIFIIDGTITHADQFNPKKGRLHIDHYNPQLFLAIAAMSERDQFWPGEYGVCEYEYSTEYAKGCIYRVEKELNGKIFTEKNNGHLWIYKEREAGILNFRKASLEELVSHFSKQEEPEKATSNTIPQDRELQSQITELYQSDSPLIENPQWQPKPGEYVFAKDKEGWGRLYYGFELNGVHYGCSENPATFLGRIYMHKASEIRQYPPKMTELEAEIAKLEETLKVKNAELKELNAKMEGL